MVKRMKKVNVMIITDGMNEFRQCRSKKRRIKKDNSRKIEAPCRGAIEMEVKSKFRVASGRKRVK